MYMKKVFFAILFLVLFLFSPSSAFAKRLLPYLRSGGSTKTVVVTTSTRGVTSSVKFRGDRRAIVVTLSNINAFQGVSYILTYTGNGVPQGVTGSITPGENSTTREIIFGTCSNGICRYDSNITNAKFIRTTTLNSGLKIRKTFVLKV